MVGGGIGVWYVLIGGMGLVILVLVMVVVCYGVEIVIGVDVFVFDLDGMVCYYSDGSDGVEYLVWGWFVLVGVILVVLVSLFGELVVVLVLGV